MNRHGLQQVLTVLSRSVSFPTLNISLSWQERVWQLSGTFSVFVPTTGLRSIRRNRFFVKRIYIDLLGTGRFSSILHGSRVSSNNGLPQLIGSNNGLPRSIMTWNWLVRLEISRWLHNLSFWSLSMFWTQFSFPVVFQGEVFGGRCDMYSFLV